MKHCTIHIDSIERIDYTNREGVMLMLIGYVRVSTVDQNTIRQEVMMQELGVEEIYIDRASGKDTKRPELQKMLSYARRGDTVVVESISRFARNTRDLLELVDTLTKREVKFISKKENIDTSTAAGVFMLTVFGAIAQLERAYILDRQREGIEIAKKEGKFKGRKRIENSKFAEVYKEWKSGSITAVKAMAMLEMKSNTFYRRVAEHEKA